MPGTTYENPNPNSNSLTYTDGKQLSSGQSFFHIRKKNIDNLEKEYNYYYPRCLDLYKKWKYAQLKNDPDKNTLNSQYQLCSNKLNTLKLKLEEANSVTSEQMEILKDQTNLEDKNIFINQQEINNSTNTLKEKQGRLETDDIKINDYNQLNNSISTQNIIWLILLLIFIVGALLLSYFYFSSGEGGEGLGEGMFEE